MDSRADRLNRSSTRWMSLPRSAVARQTAIAIRSRNNPLSSFKKTHQFVRSGRSPQ